MEFERREKEQFRRRFLAINAVSFALVLLFGGSAGYLYLYGKSDARRISDAIRSLNEKQAREATEDIGADVRDKLLQSTYFVIIRDSVGREMVAGAASPVAPHTLATTARTAQMGQKLDPGAKMLVRAPGPQARSFEVVEAREHPGYDAFERFIAQDPTYAAVARQCAECLHQARAYNVGILRVDGATPLSPILDIARREDLLELRAGLPIALAAYPMENIAGGNVQALWATPTFGRGVITGITDMFSLPAPPTRRRSIRNNVPAGRGGGPIVGANGRLLAIADVPLTSAVRAPNLSTTSYAERADLLLDLISGVADSTVDSERVYWSKQIENLKQGFDFIVPEILNALRPNREDTPLLLSQQKFPLAAADQVRVMDNTGRQVLRRQKHHAIRLLAETHYAIIAYAEGGAPLELYLMAGGKIAEKDDRQGIWYPNTSYTSAHDTEADVFVLGEDADVTYNLLYYVWKPPAS